MIQERINLLQKAFGRSKLQNNGVELMVRCPVCKHPEKLKMNIRVDKGLWHCWVCTTAGRNVSKLLKMVNPGVAREWQLKYARKLDLFDTYEDKIELPTLPKDFKLVLSNLWDPEALAIRNYCHGRGINDDLMWRWRIGYSNEFKFKRKLIIPSFDDKGVLNYWTSRTIEKEAQFKYMNAPTRKSAIIFNELDIDWNANELVLVEGPLDLVKCSKLNATCLLGSAMSRDAHLLYKIILNSIDVVLCLDPDAWEKQLKIARTLTDFDINVRLASPKYGDVGDLSEDDVVKLVANSIQYDSTTELLQKIKKIGVIS